MRITRKSPQPATGVKASIAKLSGSTRQVAGDLTDRLPALRLRTSATPARRTRRSRRNSRPGATYSLLTIVRSPKSGKLGRTTRALTTAAALGSAATLAYQNREAIKESGIGVAARRRFGDLTSWARGLLTIEPGTVVAGVPNGRRHGADLPTVAAGAH